MNNGDEGNTITFDDSTGVVYFTKPGKTRALDIANCAWVEFENDVKPAPRPEGLKK